MVENEFLFTKLEKLVEEKAFNELPILRTYWKDSMALQRRLRPNKFKHSTICHTLKKVSF